MAAQTQITSEAPGRRGDWEWFWRFLAAVMVFVVGWVIWIAVQISPQPLVTPAAYEAAAQARASRNAQGVITQAVPREPVAAPKQEPRKTPPVDVEKLRLSDSLSAPAVQEPGKK